MINRRFIGYIKDNIGIISGSEYHHLVNVLRAKRNSGFYFVDGTGRVYKAHVLRIDRQKKVVLARLYEMLENNRTEEIGVYLSFALFNENRLRFLLEKCTEIGISGFLLFLSARSKRKVNEVKDGWRKVIESAVKQSKRGSVPEIMGVMPLEEAILKAKEIGNIFLLDNEGVSLESLKYSNENNAVLFVGPEGGFEENEKKIIKNLANGVVSLGKNVLRTETAAIIASYEFIKHKKTKGGEALVRSPSA